MRAIACFHAATVYIQQINIRGVEEAILQTNIPVAAERSANAGNRLPSQTRIRIINKAGETVDAVVSLDAGNPDAAANETVDAVIIAKIQHTVQHEAER